MPDDEETIETATITLAEAARELHERAAEKAHHEAWDRITDPNWKPVYATEPSATPEATTTPIAVGNLILEALRAESSAAGKVELAAICDIALDGQIGHDIARRLTHTELGRVGDMTQAGARRACLAAIRDAHERERAEAAGEIK